MTCQIRKWRESSRHFECNFRPSIRPAPSVLIGRLRVGDDYFLLSGFGRSLAAWPRYLGFLRLARLFGSLACRDSWAHASPRLPQALALPRHQPPGPARRRCRRHCRPRSPDGRGRPGASAGCDALAVFAVEAVGWPPFGRWSRGRPPSPDAASWLSATSAGVPSITGCGPEPLATGACASALPLPLLRHCRSSCPCRRDRHRGRHRTRRDCRGPAGSASTPGRLQ